MQLRLTRGRFDPARYDDVMRAVPDITAAIRALPEVQGIALSPHPR